MLITSDGFVWLRVNNKAKEVFQSGLFELYEVDDDEVDRLIESAEDLNLALEMGHHICIEVGHYHEQS